MLRSTFCSTPRFRRERTAQPPMVNRLKVDGSGTKPKRSMTTEAAGSPLMIPILSSSTLLKSTAPKNPIPAGGRLLKSTTVVVAPAAIDMSNHEYVSIAEVRLKDTI